VCCDSVSVCCISVIVCCNSVYVCCRPGLSQGSQATQCGYHKSAREPRASRGTSFSPEHDTALHSVT
jgi:hypothetical protein